MTKNHLVAAFPISARDRMRADGLENDHGDEPMLGLRRSTGRIEGVVNGVEAGGRHGAESEAVASLLLGKLNHESPSDDQQVTGTLEIRRAFLRHCFTNRLTAYERGHRFYGHLDTGLNLMSIAAGIAASLLVASTAAKGLTIALAVGIAGCQTVSQWLKPAERAAHRGQAASALRREAWDMLEGRERYRGKDTDHAWDLFCDRVEMIEGREQTTEHGEGGSMSTAGLGDALAGADRRR
jgi:hypothetical protein